MNPELLARVSRAADREALFRRTRQILVAVSGGPDSVACLLVLRELASKYGFALHVAHFDHQLRPESHTELEWVGDLCASLDVPFLSGEGDVGGVARQQRASIEDTARRMRYQFLGFVAAEKRTDAIATGHTADDQAETVLMRVLRGTGVRGIRGMLPSSPVPGTPAQRLIRPLLPLRRAETVAICAEAGIEPRFDASNDDARYARNRLRRDVLPALREINPSVEDALIGLAQSARELFADVERASFGAQPTTRGPVGAIFERQAFAALPHEAMTLVIEREASFYSLVPEVNRTRIENLRQVLQQGTGRAVFGDTVVEVSVGKLRIGPAFEAEPFEPKILNAPGITLAGPWRMQLVTDPPDPTAGVSVARIETGRQKGALRLRRLRAGDRIHYRGIYRKVSDLLVNAKVPRWDRANAVAVTDSEKVLAVLCPAGVFETDALGEEPLYARLSAAQPPSTPMGGSALVLPS